MGIFDYFFGKDVEKLISDLNDENENIRSDAVIAMENKGDKRLLKPLYKASLNKFENKDILIRIYIALFRNLWRLTDPKMRNLIRPYYENGDVFHSYLANMVMTHIVEGRELKPAEHEYLGRLKRAVLWHVDTCNFIKKY